MGTKQSIPVSDSRTRVYSSLDIPSSVSINGNGRTTAMALTYQALAASASTASRAVPAPRNAGGPSGVRPQSLHQSELSIAHFPESSRGTAENRSEESRSRQGPHLLIGSLPAHLSPHVFEGFRCPVCAKFVSADDADLHLIMCLTKPRITYNEDVLAKDAGECVICLEELLQGDTIARLPCLCVYHKGCIDEWFVVNRSCPGHPSD